MISRTVSPPLPMTFPAYSGDRKSEAVLCISKYIEISLIWIDLMQFSFAIPIQRCLFPQHPKLEAFFSCISFSGNRQKHMVHGTSRTALSCMSWMSWKRRSTTRTHLSESKNPLYSQKDTGDQWTFLWKIPQKIDESFTTLYGRKQV